MAIFADNNQKYIISRRKGDDGTWIAELCDENGQAIASRHYPHKSNRSFIYLANDAQPVIEMEHQGTKTSIICCDTGEKIASYKMQKYTDEASGHSIDTKTLTRNKIIISIALAALHGLAFACINNKYHLSTTNTILVNASITTLITLLVAVKAEVNIIADKKTVGKITKHGLGMAKKIQLAMEDEHNINPLLLLGILFINLGR